MRLPLLALLASCPFTTAADWVPVATELVKAEKPGYGGLTGVAVDRATGRVFVDVSDRGVFRSADQGKTWERLGKEPIKGRTERPGCLLIDPTGKTKRVLMALVYGSPVLVGSVETGDWRAMHAKSAHVDWCALDWTDPEMKFVLALKHEADGLILMSRDGGQSFTEIGKGYEGPGWVFDADTAVLTTSKTKDRPKASVVRTTDGGKTFQPAGDFAPAAQPQWFGDVLYWLTESAVMKTTDKGATWTKVGDVKAGRYGPVFGKTADHVFVLTAAGVVESTDGGATWAKPVPVAPELKGVSVLTWLDYDPINDVLYTAKMGATDLYALRRAGAK